MATDAFGKLRTSEVLTTFSYYPSPVTANNSLDIDIWVTSGNAQTYISQNYVNMPVTTAATNYALRQTKCPMMYQPGKSRLIYMTGVPMITTPVSTANSYIGLFNVDTSNPPAITEGMYFRCSGTALYFEDVTQNGTVSAVQSSWNIDTFDGTGPSGKTLTIANASLTMLIVFDQQWLGVGRIRCGFVLSGVLYYAHEFLHAGVQVQYTATPRLRLSYYITGTVANSMRQMCSSHLMEGGYTTTGRHISISTPIATGVPLGTIGVKYILLAVKLQSTYTNGTIIPTNISSAYIAAANKMGQYELQLHSTNGNTGSITGTLTYANELNGITQYAIGDGTQYINANGYVLTSGFVASQYNLNLVTSDYELMLTRMIATQYDTLYLVGSGNTSSDTMYTSLDYIEDI